LAGEDRPAFGWLGIEVEARVVPVAVAGTAVEVVVVVAGEDSCLVEGRLEVKRRTVRGRVERQACKRPVAEGRQVGPFVVVLGRIGWQQGKDIAVAVASGAVAVEEPWIAAEAVRTAADAVAAVEEHIAGKEAGDFQRPLPGEGESKRRREGNEPERQQGHQRLREQNLSLAAHSKWISLSHSSYVDQRIDPLRR
jgi:hypothetical protein